MTIKAFPRCRITRLDRPPRATFEEAKRYLLVARLDRAGPARSGRSGLLRIPPIIGNHLGRRLDHSQLPHQPVG